MALSRQSGGPVHTRLDVGAYMDERMTRELCLRTLDHLSEDVGSGVSPSVPKGTCCIIPIAAASMRPRTISSAAATIRHDVYYEP